MRSDVYTVAEMGLTVARYAHMTANSATKSMIKSEYEGHGYRKRTNFALVNVKDKALYVTGG